MMSKDTSSDCTARTGCCDADNSDMVETVTKTNIKEACTVAEDTELLAEDTGNAGSANGIDQEPDFQPNQEIIDVMENLDIAEAIEQLELEVSRWNINSLTSSKAHKLYHVPPIY